MCFSWVFEVLFDSAEAGRQKTLPVTEVAKL